VTRTAGARRVAADLRIRFASSEHQIGGGSTPTNQLAHGAHGRGDVAEERLVASAQVIEAIFPVGVRVNRSFAGAYRYTCVKAELAGAPPIALRDGAVWGFVTLTSALVLAALFVIRGR
jgi:hypothetical protein